MRCIYVIQITAKVFQDIIDYSGYWNGYGFEKSSRRKWCIIDQPSAAVAEFKKITATADSGHWGGRYKITLIEEIYINGRLNSEQIVESFQTPRY